MNLEQFQKIMDDDKLSYSSKTVNHVFKGLEIIQKYLPKIDIEGADHDIIYSAMTDQILEAGLTEEDAKELCRLGWHLEDDGLVHYV